MNVFVKQIFDNEKNRLKKEIEKVEEIVVINDKLKKYNWVFIYPFVFGSDIDQLAEITKNDNINKKEILKIFARHFYDLRTTAYYIGASFKQRKSLEAFCHLIDQSVFMALQKDFAGAINTLIPVIEGSIRHYLVTFQGKKHENLMRSSDLFRVFLYLKNDYLKLMGEHYASELFLELHKVLLDQNQITYLLELHQKYIDGWFSIIEDFFRNNLYLDTRGTSVSDVLNRHSILHGFNGKIYYNFENFLKIFNSIHFLSWSFGIADKNSSIIPDLPYDNTTYKWKAFEKIRLISRITTKVKSSVYEKYTEFNKNEFEEILVINEIEKIPLNVPTSSIEGKLKFIDQTIVKKQK